MAILGRSCVDHVMMLLTIVFFTIVEARTGFGRGIETDTVVENCPSTFHVFFDVKFTTLLALGNCFRQPPRRPSAPGSARSYRDWGSKTHMVQNPSSTPYHNARGITAAIAKRGGYSSDNRMGDLDTRVINGAVYAAVVLLLVLCVCCCCFNRCPWQERRPAAGQRLAKAEESDFANGCECGPIECGPIECSVL